MQVGRRAIEEEDGREMGEASRSSPSYVQMRRKEVDRSTMGERNPPPLMLSTNPLCAGVRFGSPAAGTSPFNQCVI
jgi:hypothetical protein